MKGIVRFSYQKTIDASASSGWDRDVFESTYRELYMQAQLYNQQQTYQTFQELIDQVPNADRLHALTSRAAVGYLKQLNQLIPDIRNASGNICLPFTQFTFSILASHLQRPDDHRIAITFYSDPLSWIDNVGDQLLIAYGDQREAWQSGSEFKTDLISLQPGLSIWSYQPFQPAVS